MFLFKLNKIFKSKLHLSGFSVSVWPLKMGYKCSEISWVEDLERQLAQTENELMSDITSFSFAGTKTCTYVSFCGAQLWLWFIFSK